MKKKNVLLPLVAFSLAIAAAISSYATSFAAYDAYINIRTASGWDCVDSGFDCNDTSPTGTCEIQVNLTPSGSTIVDGHKLGQCSTAGLDNNAAIPVYDQPGVLEASDVEQD